MYVIHVSEPGLISLRLGISTKSSFDILGVVINKLTNWEIKICIACMVISSCVMLGCVCC